jgi:hypothetical protein
MLVSSLQLGRLHLTVSRFVKLQFMKPETLGASELTYEKFSLNELRAKQLHETRVTGCRYFTQSFARFCQIFFQF